MRMFIILLLAYELLDQVSSPVELLLVLLLTTTGFFAIGAVHKLLLAPHDGPFEA